MKLFKKKKRGGNIWPFSYYNNIFTLVLSGFTTSTRLNRKRSDTILPSFVLKKFPVGTYHSQETHKVPPRPNVPTLMGHFLNLT